jgi:histidinol dehydrogenase
MPIDLIATRDAGFEARFARLRAWQAAEDAAVVEQARAVIADVRARGDAALVEYTARFDGLAVRDAADLVIHAPALAAACAGLGAADRAALERAAGRIRDFHLRQRDADARSFEYEDALGNRLGQRVSPLARAGLYVPGGGAAYPSSVLMTAIPAQVAGVGETVLCAPTPRGERSPLVLAAAHLAGVHRIFTVGGAQAIAAMAFGTATVPRVDKIVGPGGVHVTAAKRLVFGPVGIDMIAGPSEVVVIADGSVDVRWVAADLCSQAEHDVAAQAILLSPDRDYLLAVRAALARMLETLPRRDIVARSLAARGALIETADLDEALALADRIAPEHLELAVAEPRALLPRVRNAGAIFLGGRTGEVLGDYVAGPSHVLPTAGTARFASPLGVADFQRRTSLIEVSAAGLQALARDAALIAAGEGLSAHALAAELRIGGQHNRD